MKNIRPVIVIGGGIAGLTTALALHRCGVPCFVFEQQKELTGVFVHIFPYSYSHNVM